MGARLSQPRGPAGSTESSVPAKAPTPPSPKKPFPSTINGRTIVAPVAAFTMACLLFVYARTSIRAAKANAQRHRDADTGGEGLSLLKESRRRHGMEKKLEGSGGTVSELVSAARAQWFGGNEEKREERTGAGTSEAEQAERLKALKGARSRKREG